MQVVVDSVENKMCIAVYILVYCRFYVWDILHASIRKINKTVAQLEQELEELKDKKDEADNKVKLLRQLIG